MKETPFFTLSITILLIFAPLAFGSVQPGPGAFLIVTISFLGLVLLVRELKYPAECEAYHRAHSHLTTRTAGLHAPFIILAALVVIQVAAGLSLVPQKTLLAASHLAAMAVLFIVVLNTMQSRAQIRRLTITLLVIGVAIAHFGIIQSLTWNGKLFWVRNVGGGFGPYVNKNHFAGLMTLLVPLSFGYLLSIGKRRRPTEKKDREREVRPRQILAAFITATMTGALFMSLSRGGMLSLLLALSLMGLILGTRKGAKSRLWLAAATVALSLTAALWLGGETILARLSTLLGVLEDPGSNIRTEVWKDALTIVRDHPLFGTGFGTFSDIYPKYKTVDTPLHFIHTHNDHLQLLVEGGIIGFATMALAATIFYKKATRMITNRRDQEVVYLGLGGLFAITAFLFHSTTTFNHHIPANALYFTVIAALTLKTLHSKS